MRTYLLTWNPTRWAWENLAEDLQLSQSGQAVCTRWSCGNRKNIAVGDRVFLLKQGPNEPRGIIASGKAASDVWQDQHFADPNSESNYIEVQLDVLLDPERDPLPRTLLDQDPFPAVNWNTQVGGIEIDAPIGAALEQRWSQHLQQLGIEPVRLLRPSRKRRYWWVSQNKTGPQEIAGGYMWSPKKDSSGGRNFSYEFMRECAPGDIVFSFVDAAISTVGVVAGHCFESGKPDDFGAAGDVWQDDGWCVPVRFQRTTQSMRPADNMATLGPLLPKKYSPIQPSGRGNQSYLFPVPEALASAILSLVLETPENISAGLQMGDGSHIAQENRERRERHELQKIVQDASISETERTSLTKSRNGQQLFRERVSNQEPCCRVTGITNKDYRIASHIKPWSHSNNRERLDGNNGLLLAPHIDHLFDNGLISFDASGTLLVSPAADIESLRLMGVPVDETFNAGSFNEQQQAYLKYHRHEVFKSSLR